MSDSATLMIVLVALYVAESIFWVRRTAYLLRKNQAPTQPKGPVGTLDASVVLLSPVAPLETLFVVEPWPLTELPQSMRFGTDGKKLKMDKRSIQTSSSALARFLSVELHAVHQGEKTIEALLAQTHDEKAVHTRLEELERATRGLGLIGLLTSASFLVGAYCILFIPIAFDAWPVIVSTCMTLLVATTLMTYRAHKKLYPGLSEDRFTKVAMIAFSPMAAVRARAWVSRDALAEFHPLAAMAALSPEHLERWGRKIVREGEYPSKPASKLQAALHAANGALLDRFGLSRQRLLTPPEHSGTDRSYCPRCETPYAAEAGSCSDCNVPLQRFDSVLNAPDPMVSTPEA